MTCRALSDPDGPGEYVSTLSPASLATLNPRELEKLEVEFARVKASRLTLWPSLVVLESNRKLLRYLVISNDPLTALSNMLSLTDFN